MRKLSLRPFGTPLAVAVLALGATAIATTAAHATGDPCLSVTLTCTDATAPGEPIPFHGQVCNCGQIDFGRMTLEHLGFGNILDQALGAGACVDFSYSYVPPSTPVEDGVIGRGYINPGDESYTVAIARATCGVAPPSEICRTPGFWGTHAGTEKTNSENITLDVIESVGSLNICGKTIDKTTLLTSTSAVEAMCVSPRGALKLQLARQLTAAALNCVMSDGDPTCAGTNIESLFGDCNDICAGIGDQTQIGACKNKLDCFNNGGVLLANGMCKLGTCAGLGVTPCDSDKVCGVNDVGLPIACVPTPNNCHDRDLVNEDLGLDFTDPGPAGSSNACNSAIGNLCTIFSCGGK